MSELERGMPAPDFTAQSISGKRITLSDFRGKFVVLFFYPAANSYGCTRQACGFRDIYEELVDLDVEVIGISVDQSEANQSFKETYSLQFPLIPDITKEISRLYPGVGRFGKANRITFLIDKEGFIEHIWKLTGLISQMKLGDHAGKVKEAVLELQSK